MRIKYQFPFRIETEKYTGGLNPAPALVNRYIIIPSLPTRKWFYCRGGWGKSKWIRIFGLLIDYGKW